MTQSSAIRDRVLPPTQPTLHYRVAMPVPESHLFEVTLQVQNWQASHLDLKMPVWTPGSYLVREYARHIQSFSAFTGRERHSLDSRKLGKNHWQIATATAPNITVCYRVFANELTVRTNHLDATHGYFNGAALFFLIPGLEKHPIKIEIVTPKPDWQVTTTLPQVPGKENIFKANNFDILVDSPFEVGIHKVYDFKVFEKKHQLAIWGQGNIDPEMAIKDIKKIIEVEANLYGDLPYQKYLFLLHLSASGYGGLEHKESCSLNYPRFGFRNREKYQRFMQLVAHEFFHLWNVKRIRPKALEVFDYEQENYTRSLWFCEGVTSYYDILIPLWARIYDRKFFLESLSKDISRFLSTPGRKIQPLSESSFDAWIKLYRRDANSNNNQISYYLKGSMVALLLDLLIRKQHNNKRSLNDVMCQMWQQFGREEIGFTPQQLQKTIESIAEKDLSQFFTRYLDTTEELPLAEYLQPFGLEIKEIRENSPTPQTGMTVVNEEGKTKVQFVEAGSPASLAGIDPGDEVLAINGFRVNADRWRDRLLDYQANDTIQVAIFHQDELQTHALKLAEPQPTEYKVVPVKSPSQQQQELLAGWLNIEH